MNIYRFILKMSAIVLILTINTVSFGMKRSHDYDSLPLTYPPLIEHYDFFQPTYQPLIWHYDQFQPTYPSLIEHYAPLQSIYPPLMQQPDNTLATIRNSLKRDTINDFLKNPPPSIKIIGKEKSNERLGRCAYHAISTILGITDEPGLLELIAPHHWTEDITLMQYFNQTNNPKIDDLVIYYHNAISKKELHLGWVTGFNLIDKSPIITSKWGARSEIIEHELFAVPLSYGDNTRFFTLKEPYQQEGRKTVLINELQNAIKKSKPIQQEVANLKGALLKLTHGENATMNRENVTIGKNFTLITQQPTLDKTYFLNKTRSILKDYPGIDINTRNKSKHHTLLMRAVIPGDYDMSQLLINFGADLTKQDKEGNTALSMAQKLNHHKIVELLQEKEKNLK